MVTWDTDCDTIVHDVERIIIPSEDATVAMVPVCVFHFPTFCTYTMRLSLVINWVMSHTI